MTNLGITVKLRYPAHSSSKIKQKEACYFQIVENLNPIPRVEHFLQHITPQLHGNSVL